MTEPEQPAGATITLAEAVELYRTGRCLETALAAHDVTAFQLTLLALFAAHPDARLGDGARRLRLNPATVTSGVDRMEKRGLVARVRRSGAGPADRRQVRVIVTERGRELLAALAEFEIEPVGDRMDGAAS